MSEGSSAKRGVVEDVKGKAKEVIGKVTGREHLEDEGRAQQEKADARRDMSDHQARAEVARAETTGHEADQRVAQARQDR